MRLEIAEITYINTVDKLNNSTFIRFFTRSPKKYYLVIYLTKNVAHNDGFEKDKFGRSILRGHKKGHHLVTVSESEVNKYKVGQKLTYHEFKQIVPEHNYVIKGK